MSLSEVNVQAMPKIAVCLAAYNGIRWLPEQLNSILEQMGVSVTVFISVDRSMDGTEAWVSQRALADRRILVLPHGEKFGGAARNFFRLIRDVDFSGFDYISFADQDDIWLPDKLLRAHTLLQSNGADAYSSNVLAFWPNGREFLINKSHPQVEWDFLFEAAGPGCTYVFKRELACALQELVKNRWADVQEIGLHDWFSYAFARAHGFRWFIDEKPGMLYRQHDENHVGVNVGWDAFFYRAQKVFGGWGLTQSALTARLVGLAEDRFVLRWSTGSRLGILSLALSARRCRRRLRDRMIFALSCLVMCVAGPRIQ